MKKILFIFSVTVLFALNSCTTQDPSNWYPEAAAYTGQFVVCLYYDDISDQNLIYGYDDTYDIPIFIYNTAANTDSEVWISDEGEIFPLKIKMAITGPSTEFYTPNRSFDATNDNVEWGGDINGGRNPYTGAYYPEPTYEGEVLIVSTDEGRGAIELAKIIPNAATTPGGNIADSIYMKINFYGADLEYISKKTDQDEWADPLVPEYEWAFNKIVAEPAYDWDCVLSGYRWTGYDEDLEH